MNSVVLALDFDDDDRGMGNSENELPRRSEIEEVWLQVIAGGMTREVAHDWVVPWVENDDPDWVRPDDVMVEAGLLYLHGLDMTRDSDAPNLISHSGPGLYVLSEAEVAARLDHWLGKCREYDSDPERSARELRKERETPRRIRTARISDP
ncbi:hypothetical protein [Nocardia pneumoniae]|uniref:hypothetical protein n=1 Tax=Nocardia pneumoniae TaxID=228601 RepID=UPI00031CEA1B|nr:hypothetical protein [Nocardia pneumoniae]